MHNRIRQLVCNGQVALGSFTFLADPAAVEVLGYAGMDFTIIDMEHTERDMSGALALIRGAQAAGVTPFVRLPELSDKQVLRATEAGAHGIVVPSVASAAQARALASACRYPPAGVRGTCRFARAASFGAVAADWQRHIERVNTEVMAVALVEDEVGVAQLEQIVAETDLVLVGRGDLSSELGVPGQVDHPRVMAVVERYERAARAHDRPLGTMCYSADDAARWIARGYRFLIYAADVNVLFKAYSGFAATVRQAGGAATGSAAERERRGDG